ncbi:MAG TPA: glycosyltransferase family 4 protein [Acidimicrobiales bacterium]|nr:glycosyltransferase family 4 protein [Acidimicrobiales bacterium]
MSARHLLVTNDFPPKVGGIQSYLWEMWRRLPAGSFAVLTTPYAGAAAFDHEQPFPIIRAREPVLLPYPWLAGRVDRLGDEIGADLVLLDPALPLGLIGPRLRHPYGVVLHGAEVTVPGRLPGSAAVLARVLRGAQLVVAAGGYPASEGERAAARALPTVVVPPGVDIDRFRPLDVNARAAARRRFGLPVDAPLVVSVSRLVPRKGIDTLVRAAARLRANLPEVVVAIAGAGRDRARLERLSRETGAPVRFLGRVPDDDLPALFGCGDVFAMLCRTRWLGLEQEGFGIVFVEAAACGVPQVAGASGGAAEAVSHGETGFVVDPPDDPAAVADAIGRVLRDPDLRRRMGHAARARAESEFAYDVLARRLAARLAPAVGVGA